MKCKGTRFRTTVIDILGMHEETSEAGKGDNVAVITLDHGWPKLPKE